MFYFCFNSKENNLEIVFIKGTITIKHTFNYFFIANIYKKQKKKRHILYNNLNNKNLK